MQGKEKKYLAAPDGAGNFDKADFVIGPNEWVNMENCRVGSTDKGVIGTVEGIGSTVLKSTPEVSVTNVVLGTAEDIPNRRFCYFIKDLYGPWDKILCYDIESETIYTVLLASQVVGGLNFDKYSLVHSARIINGLLYWTDNLNQPRRININAAINLNHPGTFPDVTAYSSPLNAEVITLIRRPPGYPLFPSKFTDGGITSNQVKSNAFRFTYRYLYRDGEISTLAAHSTLINYNATTDSSDAISITLQAAEKIDQDVQEVQMIAIYVDGNKAFVIKSWNKNNPTDATEIANHNAGIAFLEFVFYANGVEEAIDGATLVKPFDSIPIQSETLEQGTNRIFLGNNLLGYDTPVSTSLSLSLAMGTGNRRLKTDATYKVGQVFYDRYMRQCGVVFNSTQSVPDREYDETSPYPTGFNWTLPATPLPNEIPDWAYYYAPVLSLCLRTRFFLQLRGRNAAYATKDSAGNYVINKSTYAANHAACAFDISTLTTFAMGYVFNEGDIVKIYIDTDVYSLGIIGQQGNWILTELQDLGDLNASTLFLFEIFTPYTPQGEEPYFERGFVYAITDPGTASRRYGVTSGFLEGDVYYIQRTGINRVHYTRGPGEQRNDDTAATIGAVYTSQDAPDVSFTAGTSPIGGLAGFNIETDMSRYIIYASGGSDITFELSGVIRVMPDSNRDWSIYVEDNDHNRTTVIPSVTLSAYEESEHVFNGVQVTLGAGDRLFIFHEMSVANSIYYRDVNITISLPSNNITYNVETMNINDKYYRNWFTNAGRQQVIVRQGQQRKMTSIKWSNTFIPGTLTNGLSSFDSLDEKNLASELGPLRKLQITSKVNNELGAVMLGICEAETASMYLGEQQLVGSIGNAFIAQASDVIGTVNILKGSFGTVNPESVIEFRGAVFWYDAYNGKIIQYSVNGLFPISQYNATRFWKLFSDQYLSMTKDEIADLGTRPFVFTTVDPHHWELLVTIPQVLASPPKRVPDYGFAYPFDIWDGQAKTMVYKLNHEPNFWQGSYRVVPENWISIQNKVFSFKFGQLYEHNSTESYGTLYGLTANARVMFVSNQIPNHPKIYNNISIDANRSPIFTYFMTEDPYTQTSDLADFDYRNLEGIWYSIIYRNKIQPTATGYTTDALLTGEKMRGKVFKIYLEFSNLNTPLELKFVEVGYTVSSGHTTT